MPTLCRVLTAERRNRTQKKKIETTLWLRRRPRCFFRNILKTFNTQNIGNDIARVRETWSNPIRYGHVSFFVLKA